MQQRGLSHTAEHERRARLRPADHALGAPGSDDRASVSPWGPFDRCPSLQGILHFQLGRGEPMLHTRLRPHCREFLEKVARLYELHVFTFGSRLYAHTIAGEGAAADPAERVATGTCRPTSFPFPVMFSRR